jgi:hypothetical protein
MRSAPHTGKKMCEVPASTPIRFINRASHGPHHYARVEVLEGACAGTQGYVPWKTLEPEPREDQASDAGSEHSRKGSRSGCTDDRAPGSAVGRKADMIR